MAAPVPTLFGKPSSKGPRGRPGRGWGDRIGDWIGGWLPGGRPVPVPA